MSKPKPIGTILPTRKSVELTERHAVDIASQQAKIGKTLIAAGCARRVVGDEVRYYRTKDQYAVVSFRDLSIRWFAVREDGDYAMHN